MVAFATAAGQRAVKMPVEYKGASTRETKPGKVNELFDRNPGKKGSQWAR